jgi:HSP20 family molecular chaperone IbpA
MARRTGTGILDFERALDEFFDEMLISRWRRVAERGEFENAQVLDHPDRYEVRIAAPHVNPEHIEIDISGQRLNVRAPSADGVFETAYSFTVPIEAEAVQATWAEHMLIVTVPKQKPKRIKVGN